MGGDDRNATNLSKVVCNRNRERSTFLRIGSRAQFIQQHKGPGSRSTRDEVDIGDMGGEGGEILLDRLIIADIGEHGIEDGQFCMVSGHGKARLRHQCEKSDGLQRNGLATSVGARKHEFPTLAVEFNRDGNDVAALAF